MFRDGEREANVPRVPGTLEMYSVKGSCFWSVGLTGYWGGLAAK